MSYFGAGLWHFAAAMSYAGALGVLTNDDAAFWLLNPLFTLPLLISSSALFFIPDRWAKKGLWKFLHYPLPDWDVLLLGPASHRHWLTHSPLLALGLWFLAQHYPFLPNESTFVAAAAGLCAGLGSHLFWDCVGSRTHKIVFIPYWIALRPALARVYLLAGAAVSLGVALHLTGLI
jgi:hypothetical protein